jgi:hypothetical protein
MPKSRKQSPGDRDERRGPEQNMPGGPETPSSMDLHNDSVSDEERLKQDTSYITLPDVSDIPGQEHITSVGPLGEMADTTISSDDEEGIQGGKDLLADDDDIEIVMGTEADVTAEDLILLGDKDQDMDMGDDELTVMEGLDDTDFEGDLLNEGVSNGATAGGELDIPEADDGESDADSTGQGDEENNYYSLGSDDNDNLAEGTP